MLDPVVAIAITSQQLDATLLAERLPPVVHNVDMALRLPLESGLILERLNNTREAGEDLAQLVAAAQVLQRRYAREIS